MGAVSEMFARWSSMNEWAGKRIRFPAGNICNEAGCVSQFLQQQKHKHNKFTSSTAQGGGKSFKNRKPIGEVGCCESGMAERSHWWTERCLISLTLSISFSDYLPTYLSMFYVSIYLSLYLSLSLFHLITQSISIYLSISLSSVYMSSCLPVYLSVYLSIYLSICLPVYLWCSVIQCIVV